MRRIALVIALMTVGCAAQPVSPQSQKNFPDIFQKQPFNSPWITRKLTRNALPSQMVVGTRGYIWVADVGTSAISRVDMRSGARSFPISFAPNAIVIGADQNIWVSAYSGGIVARVTPSGVETDFGIGDPSATISQMIVGSDGANWFSVFESGGNNYLGRMDISGNYSLYSVPAAGSLTNGPDGNIWFTDGTNLNAMNTRGQIIAQYPFTDFGDLTTVGPDGNMWFTAGDHVDRITTSGQITPFPAPNNGLYDITNWSGKLWMTDRSFQTDSLVSFNPTTMTFGALVPSPHRLRRIITGQDGNFWMTGLNASISIYVNQILSVDPTKLDLHVGQKTGNTITVTESNYVGTWAASYRGPISVVQSSPGVFTVTAIGPGSGKVEINDSMHNSTSVPVTVE
jgi:streptogramin lyase